ncbi:transglutaminase-like domain-containing protein [Rhodopirellula halodulae]|uniref:transglutaminase-like domain-containing protein n=1 Tax=Rhodopirellula halodulae TaxID=2894198 RepID=UPI001E2A2D7C|nr:transglutaminase domain-containing protein [Rhodopirellula sp. JC737]MCC9655442.1 transglutaminase domain-containing protein [Rhodopirellula sp. JC737]
MKRTEKSMQRRSCLRALTGAFALGCVSATESFLFGQDAEEAVAPPAAPMDLTKPQATRWQVGVNIDTPVTFTSGIATFPVFMDWPEQTVAVTNRLVEGRVGNVAVRDLPGAKQVVCTIPRLTSGGSVRVEFEMEVVRQPIVAPEDTSDLVIPARMPREMRAYMGNSPMIDASHPSIRNLSRELANDAPENAWEKVRHLYDVVREKVRYQEGPIREASDALKTGVGDCEDMTSLFVALCRNAGIPARMVWIPGHCYPEFYLEPREATAARGELAGQWYPCQAAGTEQFGGMLESRPVLQKGDRFRVPEQRTPVRYVAEFFRCDRQGSKAPRVEFVRKPV